MINALLVRRLWYLTKTMASKSTSIENADSSGFFHGTIWIADKQAFSGGQRIVP
jgi:hypothetical protein